MNKIETAPKSHFDSYYSGFFCELFLTPDISTPLMTLPAVGSTRVGDYTVIEFRRKVADHVSLHADYAKAYGPDGPFHEGPLSHELNAEIDPGDIVTVYARLSPWSAEPE